MILMSFFIFATSNTSWCKKVIMLFTKPLCHQLGGNHGIYALCMCPLFKTRLEDGEDVDLGGRIS